MLWVRYLVLRSSVWAAGPTLFHVAFIYRQVIDWLFYQPTTVRFLLRRLSDFRSGLFLNSPLWRYHTVCISAGLHDDMLLIFQSRALPPSTHPTPFSSLQSPSLVLAFCFYMRFRIILYVLWKPHWDLYWNCLEFKGEFGEIVIFKIWNPPSHKCGKRLFLRPLQ